MPPPEPCVSAEQAPPDFLANAKFLERLDLRLDPDTAGWAMGKPSMRGVMRGWLRLRDGREPDTTMLMMALDALAAGRLRPRPLRLDADARVHRRTSGGGRGGGRLIWDAAGSWPSRVALASPQSRQPRRRLRPLITEVGRASRGWPRAISRDAPRGRRPRVAADLAGPDLRLLRAAVPSDAGCEWHGARASSRAGAARHSGARRDRPRSPRPSTTSA